MGVVCQCVCVCVCVCVLGGGEVAVGGMTATTAMLTA